RISARPGERLAFKVSAEPGIASYDARLVRLWCVDSHRDGPGLEEAHIPSAIDGRHPARHQPVTIGSRAEVRSPLLAWPGAFTLAVALWPTLAKAADQVVAATDGVALMLRDGRLVARLGEAELALSCPLPLREWALAVIGHDPATGATRLSAIPLEGPFRGRETATEAVLPGTPFSRESVLAFAALPGGGASYNGKLEAPRLLRGAGRLPDPVRLLDADPPPHLEESILAAWDFARGMHTLRIEDAGPGGLHGSLFNMPGRAMKGWRWDGSVHDWRQDP